jgi:radical SAM protein with 4Fe4S-binding SPASM domain
MKGETKMIEVMDYNAKCSVAVLEDTAVDPLMAKCDSCTATCTCGGACDSGKIHNNRAYKYLKQHKPNGN